MRMGDCAGYYPHSTEPVGKWHTEAPSRVSYDVWSARKYPRQGRGGGLRLELESEPVKQESS